MPHALKSKCAPAVALGALVSRGASGGGQWRGKCGKS